MINLKQFGTNYGGFFYPENLLYLNSDSIIYCVGAGEDITHDIEIANKLKSKVYIFDPTPRAISHIKYVIDVFNNIRKPIYDKKFGGGDKNYWNILLNNKIDTNNIIFRPYGLHIIDGNFKFYTPSNKEHVSCSLVNGMKSNEFIKVPVKSLNNIMKEFNHKKIDLLKIDIEGLECSVLDKMINDNIFPKYLAVDFDLGWNGERIRDIQTCKNTINK